MPPAAVASWVTAVHATLIAVTGTSTLIAIHLSSKDVRQKRERAALYEDEDGVATEETQSRYQKTAKWLLIFLGLFSVAGLGTAISYGITGLIEAHGQYRSSASPVLAGFSPTVIWVSFPLLSLSHSVD